jgi:hypothetical protein
MSAPLIYDLIIGSLFLAVAGIGARFGIFKLFLIFLAFWMSSIIKWLLVLVLGMKQFLILVQSTPFGFLDIAMIFVTLVLVIWIIVRVPRAHSALSRASGALFAVVLSGCVAVIGSFMTNMIIDLREVRAQSLSGPIIFALGDLLIAQLPDDPDDFFGKPAKVEQQ